MDALRVYIQETPAVVAIFRQFLKDPELKIRIEAAEHLVSHGQKLSAAGIESAFLALRHHDAEVRSAGCCVLAHLNLSRPEHVQRFVNTCLEIGVRDSASLEILLDLDVDAQTKTGAILAALRNPERRALAERLIVPLIRSLRKLRVTSAELVDILVEISQKAQRTSVRLEAAAALIAIDRQYIETVGPTVLTNSVGLDENPLPALDEPAAVRLFECLLRKDVVSQSSANWVAGILRPWQKQLLPRVRELLKNDQPRFRKYAIRLLEEWSIDDPDESLKPELESQESLDALLRLTLDVDLDGRLAATAALCARYGNCECFETELKSARRVGGLYSALAEMEEHGLVTPLSRRLPWGAHRVRGLRQDSGDRSASGSRTAGESSHARARWTPRAPGFHASRHRGDPRDRPRRMLHSTKSWRIFSGVAQLRHKAPPST